MQPIRNREVIVEAAGNTYAMAPWVKQLGIHVKGLTPNPGENQIQRDCRCFEKSQIPASQSGIISSSPAMTSTDKPQVVTNEPLDLVAGSPDPSYLYIFGY